MNKHTKKPAEGKASESSKPSKETIKHNSDKANAEQKKKPTKAEQVERNYDKDQE